QQQRQQTERWAGRRGTRRTPPAPPSTAHHNSRSMHYNHRRSSSSSSSQTDGGSDVHTTSVSGSNTTGTCMENGDDEGFGYRGRGGGGGAPRDGRRKGRSRSQGLMGREHPREFAAEGNSEVEVGGTDVEEDGDDGYGHGYGLSVSRLASRRSSSSSTKKKKKTVPRSGPGVTAVSSSSELCRSATAGGAAASVHGTHAGGVAAGGGGSRVEYRSGRSREGDRHRAWPPSAAPALGSPVVAARDRSAGSGGGLDRNGGGEIRSTDHRVSSPRRLAARLGGGGGGGTRSADRRGSSPRKADRRGSSPRRLAARLGADGGGGGGGVTRSADRRASSPRRLAARLGELEAKVASSGVRGSSRGEGGGGGFSSCGGFLEAAGGGAENGTGRMSAAENEVQNTALRHALLLEERGLQLERAEALLRRKEEEEGLLKRELNRLGEASVADREVWRRLSKAEGEISSLLERSEALEDLAKDCQVALEKEQRARREDQDRHASELSRATGDAAAAAEAASREECAAKASRDLCEQMSAVCGQMRKAAEEAGARSASAEETVR
ncbi:unnamed protein product, partial [Ectocarpus sp. 13 AM-2016]